VYYNGGRIRAEHESRPETHLKLAAQFLATFPQREGVAFTPAWWVGLRSATPGHQFWRTI
jgi:hypothetical protein